MDFYDIDELFSEEEKMVRKTVREFVQREVRPIIKDHYEKATFPKHLIQKMAELGFLGAQWKGYGCAGLNSISYGLIMQELERGDSGLRSFVSVQGALVMYPILTFGSEEQKEKWLPLLQQGKAIGCFGLTEPSAGSDPASMQTTAVKKGNKYILNGGKAWITNGSQADISVVFAKTSNGIGGFLVEKGTPGFKTRDIVGKFSLRASVTSELFFQECEIPASNLLPKTEGLKSALMCLNQARYGIVWGVMGAAMDCYQQALDYAKTRIVFKKPLASYQLVQNKLTWIVSEITKGQLLAWRLGKLKDAGRVKHYQISLAKKNNCWMALEVARIARDMLGANGISYDYPIARHMCNLEAVKTYEGTDDIHSLIVGEAITGLSAFH